VVVYLKSLAASVLPGSRPQSTDLLSGRADGRRSRRVDALVWRKEVAYVGGMIRGHRQLHRQLEIPSREADSSYLAN
jgi:hypothetical protein